MTLVAILTVRRDALEKFRAFERRAAAVMKKHGGRIESRGRMALTIGGTAMSIALEKLEREARLLSPEERARLADLLLESLRDAPLGEIERAWDREIGERIAAYERGELKTLTAEDVFAEARRLAR